jgi:hypothetical protein
MVTSKPTNKFTVYTIVNYGQYQDCEDTTNQQLTNNQPATNQQLTTKEEIKHLNIKEIIPNGFIDFWEIWPTSKRKGSKSACLKVWKTKKLELVSKVIIDHVNYCKVNGVWKDPQFIEAPLVYLNQAKWDGAELTEKTDNCILACPKTYPFSKWNSLSQSEKLEVVRRNDVKD